MELTVKMHDEIVGTCELKDLGLYWGIRCSCRVLSDRVERLYCGQRRLGVLEKDGQSLTLSRRVSKSSCPELPPKDSVLTLHPVEEKAKEEKTELEPWEGQIMGYDLKGFRCADHIVFPYEENAPCPCEALLCHFEIADGFWRLPMQLLQAQTEE